MSNARAGKLAASAGSDESRLRSVINEPGLVDWIKRAKAGGVGRIDSVCTGAIVLAAASLLEGKRATTHWSSCAELARLCPSALIEATSIYTSAVVTAGIDLVPAMVEEDFGRASGTDQHVKPFAGSGSIDALRSAFGRRNQSTPGEYRNTLT